MGLNAMLILEAVRKVWLHPDLRKCSSNAVFCNMVVSTREATNVGDFWHVHVHAHAELGCWPPRLSPNWRSSLVGCLELPLWCEARSNVWTNMWSPWHDPQTILQACSPSFSECIISCSSSNCTLNPSSFVGLWRIQDRTGNGTMT